MIKQTLVPFFFLPIFLTAHDARADWDCQIPYYFLVNQSGTLSFQPEARSFFGRGTTPDEAWKSASQLADSTAQEEARSLQESIRYLSCRVIARGGTDISGYYCSQAPTIVDSCFQTAQ
jgi:hypothetical protein